MQVHATTNKVLFTKPTLNGWDIVLTPSRSNPNKFYTVDVTHGRCSCPGWIFQKGSVRNPCTHLRALGFTRVVQFADIQELPKVTQSQKETAKIVEIY